MSDESELPLDPDVKRFFGRVTNIGMIVLHTVQYIESEQFPTSYIVCDGRELPRADYPELFEILGEYLGKGNGSTTFNVPNLTPPAQGLFYVICAE